MNVAHLQATGPRPRRLYFAILIGCCTCSCGTLDSGRAWGEDAQLWPGLERLGSAANEAWRDPWTWAPLAAAGVLTIGDWDEDISEWALEEHPFFDSTDDAREFSGDMWELTRTASVLTTLATPGGDDAGTWIVSKTKGLLVREAASEFRSFTTGELKETFDRTRPDASDTLSLPSGHSSAAFNHAKWAVLNLEHIEMPDELRTSLQWTLYGSAAAGAWGRVEGGRHYPVDVLVGAALGNFSSHFFQAAFLGLDDPDTPQITIQADRETMLLGVRFSF